MFVACEYLRSLLAFDHDWNDLCVKASALDRAFSPLLRAQSILILLFPGNMEFSGQDLSSLSHYHLSHWAEEAVAIHAIDQFLIPKTVPPARAVEVIRQARHRFRAAGKHAFQVAVCDFLKSQRDCFESGGACLVHRVRRYSFGNAAADRDLARDVWAASSLSRVADDRLLDIVCGDSGTLQRSLGR